MFGYVIANRELMTPEQEARYRACYCGLCRALRRRRGSLSRLTLNYDMTFLVLLLGSMYEPEEESGEERCAIHPVHRHGWSSSWVTDYAADMNLALAYLNCMDDWKDDRALLRRAEAGLLSEQYFYVQQKYPEKCAFIESCLDELAEIEAARLPDPDEGAKCFGRLMGEVFAFGPGDIWLERLRAFGESLGEFIYIMDAVLDLEEDKRRGSYNPLAVYAGGKSEDDLRYTLTMLIGGSAELFEKLPLVQDVDIMRNVLYSGVWLRYNAEMERRHKGKEGGKAGEP
ncbi:MAG: DUF5685 family protein [Clostridia bacterium]|nr:DUF5685 family protein [Clostridia bacterium]